jgi:hypothetical protein
MTFMLLQASTHCCIVYASMAIMSPTSFAFLFVMQSYSLLLYDRSVGGHELSIVGVGAAAFSEKDKVGLLIAVEAAAMTAFSDVATDDFCEESVSVAAP